MEKLKLLRVIYLQMKDAILIAKTLDNKPVLLNCNDYQKKELSLLCSMLQEGNIFNLLNVKLLDSNNIEAEFIIFEPDYLIDISSLSECFRPYGNHPLNYTLSRLQPKENSAALLLGNTANFFIDEFVYEDENLPVNYLSSLKKLFQTYAFELATCEDLKNQKIENVFFANCKKHFNHIGYTVKKKFPKVGIDKEKVILEPSFISSALGLQGRLDIMLCDHSAFIELKSGKAVEDFYTGGAFIRSAENHYVQMILYLAVLEFNLNLEADAVHSYLLYSKYPVLSKERHSQKSLQEALSLRNQIVAWEYALQKANDIHACSLMLSNIHSQNLNLKQLSGRFFDNYLTPGINDLSIRLAQLKEHEKTYFLRIYIFVLKELWLSKAGEREYEGVKKASVLWNASTEDKLIAGELLFDLKIIDNQAASKSHTIKLNIPEYPDLYLPNFRQGDTVVLYERNTAADTVNNHQVFKGSVESLESNQITIRLRYRQKNPFVWNENSFYAVEHDYIDTAYTGMFRALTSFIHANQDRKDLLTLPPSSKEKSMDEIFLLVGPPGTGKTSIALKQMVETEITKNNSHILLLSYTNRAVDEICKALTGINRSLPFIRIGNELNCDPEFRSFLLEKQLAHCTKRSEVLEVICRCRIFVGTVASVWNKPELFQIKCFDLAIIDEATQLLEPHLLGVFCAKNRSGENAVKRFILIGDQKQLPAIVLQTKEESKVHEPVLNQTGLTDLRDSLFERLYRKYKEEGLIENIRTLSKQGRMHPDISAFPSEYFYEGRLENAGLPHQMEIWTHRKRLIFYPVNPSDKDFPDKANSNEAKKAVEICMELYQNCLTCGDMFNPHTIGIITPYRNQIALIRKKLIESGIACFSNIVVDTVERFQGSQRDIIIYSFCVKTDNQLQALPNMVEENGKQIDRKLNVVLTRAKKQLHIIGNELLLSKNPLYQQLINHIKKQAGD